MTTPAECDCEHAMARVLVTSTRDRWRLGTRAHATKPGSHIYWAVDEVFCIGSCCPTSNEVPNLACARVPPACCQRFEIHETGTGPLNSAGLVPSGWIGAAK